MDLGGIFVHTCHPSRGIHILSECFIVARTEPGSLQIGTWFLVFLYFDDITRYDITYGNLKRFRRHTAIFIPRSALNVDELYINSMLLVVAWNILT